MFHHLGKRPATLDISSGCGALASQYHHHGRKGATSPLPMPLQPSSSKPTLVQDHHRGRKRQNAGFRLVKEGEDSGPGDWPH